MNINVVWQTLGVVCVIGALILVVAIMITMAGAITLPAPITPTALPNYTLEKLANTAYGSGLYRYIDMDVTCYFIHNTGMHCFENIK